MSVGKICTRSVDTAEATESVCIVAQRMHERKVGSLVVVDASRQPIGMITDRDLATRVLAECRDPMRTTVRDVMTLHPSTVNEGTSIENALQSMRIQQCRRLPVVNDNGQLIGVLSLDDILGMLTKEFQMIDGLVQDESPKSLAESF